MGLSHAVSLPCAKNIILFLCLFSLSFNTDEIEIPYKNIYLEILSYKLLGISLRSIVPDVIKLNYSMKYISNSILPFFLQVPNQLQLK